MMQQDSHALIFFLDGVGLGGDDPEVNPFVMAKMPKLTALLGEGWFLNGREPIHVERASLVPTDANLGMPRNPESATGQATILTGKNVSQLIGEHYGPKPNPPVREVLAQGSLFSDVVDAGGSAALLTPYPQGYFDAIESGRRLFSAVPQAAHNAGVTLFTDGELRAGRAISPMFTNQFWRNDMGHEDMPLLTVAEAGERIAQVARMHQFSFFEHWPSDRMGHRGSLESAVIHLDLLDTAIGHTIDAWDDENGLLIVTSDHGNIEEKNHRKHTRNPVPTILVGKNHKTYAKQIKSLTDIASVVRSHLNLTTP